MAERVYPHMPPCWLVVTEVSEGHVGSILKVQGAQETPPEISVFTNQYDTVSKQPLS